MQTDILAVFQHFNGVTMIFQAVGHDVGMWLEYNENKKQHDSGHNMTTLGTVPK